jgi:hypothetical protein
MAITNSQLSATSKTVIFDATGENAVTCIIFCNTSPATDATVTVWAVPAAIAASDANMILNEVSVPAGETFSLDTERFIFADSDTLQAQASQDIIITATVSYVQTG